MSANKTILVVDDESAILRLSRRLLQRHNFQVLESGSGEAGLRLIQETESGVDAVLLDLSLPDGEGTDWARRYREVNPELPIIFFTGSLAPAGWTQQDHLRNYYLKKPFTPDSIYSV
ncbi:MAG: response regulator, partial [Kiritimatiellia bacterium]